MIETIRYSNDKERNAAIKYFELRGATKYPDDSNVQSYGLVSDCIALDDGEWVCTNFDWCKINNDRLFEIQIVNHVAVIQFNSEIERFKALCVASNHKYVSANENAYRAGDHNAVFFRSNGEWKYGVVNEKNMPELKTLLLPIPNDKIPMDYTHVTREGYKARIIGERVSDSTPIIVAVSEDKSGEETIITLTRDLKFRDHKESAYDLFKYTSVRIRIYQNIEDRDILVVVQGGKGLNDASDGWELVDDFVKEYTL